MPSLVAPSHNVHGLPTEIRFEAEQLPSGKKAKIPIYTFEQLENMPQQMLKNKARDLVATIGEEALPPLAGKATREALIGYILDVQISMCTTVGLRVTLQAFGTPADYGQVHDQGYFGGDGALALNTHTALQADYHKPMHLIQPAHRDLDHATHIEVNQIEAHRGMMASKQRNMGSIHLG